MKGKRREGGREGRDFYGKDREAQEGETAWETEHPSEQPLARISR